MTKPTPPPDPITRAEAARILRVSEPRVSRLIELGTFAVYNFGSRKFLSRGEVEARLASKPKAGRPKKIIGADGLKHPPPRATSRRS